MIKNILVCTDGSAYGDVACDFALFLARELKARLVGLHVLDSRMLEGPLMADISGWIGAQPYGAQLQQFRELMEEKGQAVADAFADKAGQQGIEAERWIKMGHPSRVILEEESQTELLVLGQKGEHAEWIGDMMGSNVERVVRLASTPCLVTPETFKPISKIMVAYDGSAHAGQALQRAVELAQAMDVELIIVTAQEEDDAGKAEEVSVNGLKLAEAHDFSAVNMVLEGRAEEAILESASEQECDLIVAGAYGYSRIREMILGSTTNHLITHSQIPVMIVQ